MGLGCGLCYYGADLRIMLGILGRYYTGLYWAAIILGSQVILGRY